MWHCAQVDATIAKSVQRVTGSIIGAVYAYLVMLKPLLATNPYVVAAMCCLSAFACGLFVEHRFRYGSFLALYTSAVVMLAQVSALLLLVLTLEEFCSQILRG